MPISMSKYQAIRRLSLQGLGSREIARLLKVGRHTVKKYRYGEMQPDAPMRLAKRAPIREEIEADLLRMLKENAALPRKERLTARGMWKWLVSERRVAVSEQHVRRIVHDLRDAAGEEFLPLLHESGEAMQVDWGDMVAHIGGAKTAASVFVAVLPHSCALCAFVYPDKTMLSFADGHVRAFEFFGGVPRTCLYDNLKTAVKTGSGANAIKQDAFMRLEAHYGYEALFCNRAAGWEKSNVENAVAIIRSLAFTPAPRAADFSELQGHIDASVLEYIARHKIRGHARGIAEDFADERKQLLPLPRSRMDVCETTKVKVRPDQTIVYKNAKYSVPHGFVGRDITLRASPFHLELYWRGEILHRHDRFGGKDQYVLEHYLDALERKPRAVDQALPLARGVMPAECAEFLRICAAPDAKRQLVDILLDGRHAGMERTLRAISDANNTGKPSYAIAQYYLAAGSPAPSDAFEIEHGGLSRFDFLLGKDACHD